MPRHSHQRPRWLNERFASAIVIIADRDIDHDACLPMKITVVPSDHSADNWIANGEYVVRLAPLDCSAKSRTDNVKLC